MAQPTDGDAPRTAAGATLHTTAVGARERFPWLPPDARNSALIPAGQWWDAIRVPKPWGEPVAERLANHNGAIVADWDSLYWLIPTGAANQWDIPLGRGVRICGSGVWVGIPGLQCRGIPHWRISPTDVDDYRTSAALLYRALTVVLRGDG